MAEKTQSLPWTTKSQNFPRQKGTTDISHVMHLHPTWCFPTSAANPCLQRDSNSIVCRFCPPKHVGKVGTRSSIFHQSQARLGALPRFSTVFGGGIPSAGCSMRGKLWQISYYWHRFRTYDCIGTSDYSFRTSQVGRGFLLWRSTTAKFMDEYTAWWNGTLLLRHFACCC